MVLNIGSGLCFGFDSYSRFGIDSWVLNIYTTAICAPLAMTGADAGVITGTAGATTGATAVL